MKQLFLFFTATLLFIPAVAPANNTARIQTRVSIHQKETPIFFRATLDGSQETPSVSTGAKGTATFVLDDAGLSYRIVVNGLSGAITAAHFHNAAAGTSAGPVRTISFFGNLATGTWKASDTQSLTPALLAELKAGRIYVNVHTAANSSGEIRGQVLSPAGTAFWASLDGGQEVLAPLSATAPTGATA
ncbi:MAG: CHRD domain-containing protein, partial [bacterium]|nr:CHRD domain-containing protein [bacterium]